MQAKSFIEVLAHELRKEIRAEVEAEIASRAMPAAQKIETTHKADQVHLWLNLKLGGTFVGQQSAVSKYQSTDRRPQKQAAVRKLPAAAESVTERVGAAVTIEQTVAVECFRREGSKLESKFTESDLKSEFRKIAMRIHPDRHSGASLEEIKSLSARFQTLVESAEVLEAALS